MCFSKGSPVQVKITDYINNGVVEGYVLNVLTAKEEAAFEQLLPEYAELRRRLQQLQQIVLEYELGVLQKEIGIVELEQYGQQPPLHQDIIWEKLQYRLQTEQNRQRYTYEMDPTSKLVRLHDEFASPYLLLPQAKYLFAVYIATAVFVCWLFLLYTLR